MATNELIVAPSARLKRTLAPGTRIAVRGAEWVVRECSGQELELDNARVIRCEGVSGLLHGVEATFVDSLDKIEVVDPLDIEFNVDQSKNFRESRLWMDIWARKVVPPGPSLAVGHRAVVDQLPYQRVPAAMALDFEKNLRPRILIADAVGLGKTIEVGIILSELIKRGRGKRIMVVVLKSMMTQFQKELWSRFSIALEAVDRARIETIGRSIPRSMNPLDQIDRAIISVDTLKSSHLIARLQSSRWDAIVIDECHNVARRNSSQSQRNQLAAQLAKASDALILTSATPHDGSPASYASLLELLDPMLVVDPDKITKADLAPVTIQRYAKDTRLADHKERREYEQYIELSPKELALLKAVVATDAITPFIRTSLCKALMSSPEALVATLSERMPKSGGTLEKLKSEAEKLSLVDSSKLDFLVHELLSKTIPKKARIVIFTESRKTLTALAATLAKRLELRASENEGEFDPKAAIAVFHGGQPEATQQRILDDFQTAASKVRILIATDVASEGVNLHHQCHHLVHWDIPWSLITISQRNGRIDRYGQEKNPEIHYLISDTKDAASKRFSERRVVDILIAKAKHAEDALGNVGVSLGVYDAGKEDEKITKAIADAGGATDSLASLFAETIPEISETLNADVEVKIDEPWRPFASEADALGFGFVKEAARFLKLPAVEGDKNTLEIDFSDEAAASGIRLLTHALRPLSREMNLAKAPRLVLTARHETMQAEIKAARAKAGQWPQVSLGWEIHPAVDAISRLVETRFDKAEARILNFASPKGKGFLGFLYYRALYDHGGHPIFCKLEAALPKTDVTWHYLTPAEATKMLGFHEKTVNVGGVLAKTDVKDLRAHAKSLFNELKDGRVKFDAAAAHGARINATGRERNRLSTWYTERKKYLEARYGLPMQARRLASELNLLDGLRKSHDDFLEHHGRVEESNLFVRIVAVFWGAN